jgi:hypothetical protein
MTAEERQAKLFLEGAALEFFEAVLQAGRHHIGSDNFTFKVEFVVSAQESDREGGVRLGQAVKDALDAAEQAVKALAQQR